MNKVFITGGAGYIGAVLVPYLLEKGYSVDKKEIEISEPIKSLGKFIVLVKLGQELEAKIKIKVTAEK